MIIISCSPLSGLMEPAPYFSSNYYNNMLEIYRIIIPFRFQNVFVKCVSSYGGFFEVKETSWELSFRLYFFHYLISLRSNDFHDYVNWLIIGTLGMAGNCCTGLWIPIGCNDSLWRFHVSNGDRASDIFNFSFFNVLAKAVVVTMDKLFSQTPCRYKVQILTSAMKSPN